MKKILIVFTGIIASILLITGGYFGARYIDQRINQDKISHKSNEEQQDETMSSDGKAQESRNQDAGTQEESTEASTDTTSESEASEELEDDTSGENENAEDDAAKHQAEAIYDELLADYVRKWREYTDNGGKADLTSPYAAGPLVYQSYNQVLLDDGLSAAGYRIGDLDGDGVYELIIASTTSSQIYDLYTLENGSPKLILASWYRCSVCYCGDYFYRYASGGAATALVGNFELVNSNPEVKKAVYSYPNDDWSETKYYYSETSDSDPDKGVEITEEEFRRYLDSLSSETCVVDNLISFDSYVEKYGQSSSAVSDKMDVKTKVGNEWFVPSGFTSLETTDKTGTWYTYQNESLDMTIRIWETSVGINGYYGGGGSEQFLEDYYESSKNGTVDYSYYKDGGNFCVNSGCLDSGRIYYDKYMVLGEDANTVVETYFEYGAEHKEECDKVVEEFLDDCRLIVY